MVERLPPSAPDRLPTLTEVLLPPGAASPGTPMVPAPEADAPAGGAAASATPEGADQDQLVDEMLDAIQQRIDVLYEYRVREALAPALARLADRVVHELRDSLAETVREVVTRAVAEELAARKDRRP